MIEPISAAAAAVFDAVEQEFGHPPNYPTLGQVAAAALRAAANQMSAHTSKRYLSAIADEVKLHTIATELEAING
jgi:hypothetical protein